MFRPLPSIGSGRVSRHPPTPFPLLEAPQSQPPWPRPLRQPPSQPAAPRQPSTPQPEPAAPQPQPQPATAAKPQPATAQPQPQATARRFLLRAPLMPPTLEIYGSFSFVAYLDFSALMTLPFWFGIGKARHCMPWHAMACIGMPWHANVRARVRAPAGARAGPGAEPGPGPG